MIRKPYNKEPNLKPTYNNPYSKKNIKSSYNTKSNYKKNNNNYLKNIPILKAIDCPSMPFKDNFLQVINLPKCSDLIVKGHGCCFFLFNNKTVLLESSIISEDNQLMEMKPIYNIVLKEKKDKTRYPVRYNTFIKTDYNEKIMHIYYIDTLITKKDKDNCIKKIVLKIDYYQLTQSNEYGPEDVLIKYNNQIYKVFKGDNMTYNSVHKCDAVRYNRYNLKDQLSMVKGQMKRIIEEYNQQLPKNNTLNIQ